MYLKALSHKKKGTQYVLSAGFYIREHADNKVCTFSSEGWNWQYVCQYIAITAKLNSKSLVKKSSNQKLISISSCGSVFTIPNTKYLCRFKEKIRNSIYPIILIIVIRHISIHRKIMKEKCIFNFTLNYRVYN